jgi:hypothetical protein
MSIKENYQKRFDELIEYGKKLLPYERNMDFEARRKRWNAQCQDVLERAFGRSSAFFDSFRMTLYDIDPEGSIKSGLSLMEGAREQLDLISSSDKLGKKREQILEEKAEAQRRSAVVETKLWGAVIELIDLQRDQLKTKGQQNEQMVEIRKNLEDIKLLIIGLADEIKTTLKNKAASSA